MFHYVLTKKWAEIKLPHATIIIAPLYPITFLSHEFKDQNPELGRIVDRFPEHPELRWYNHKEKKKQSDNWPKVLEQSARKKNL